MKVVAPSAPKVAFLHTAGSNTDLFDIHIRQTPAAVTWTVRHEVWPDLLVAASGAEESQVAAFEETRRHLQRLAKQTDAVVLTCSTLGPALEDWKDRPVGVVRADEALANECAQAGGRILVLYAVESSRASTARVFGKAASGSCEVELRKIESAWTHFLAGRHERYANAVAQAVLAAQADYDLIALAQVSMSIGTPLIPPSDKVRTVPGAVMTRLVQLFNGTSPASV